MLKLPINSTARTRTIPPATQAKNSYATFPFSYEDLMFGEDEEEERPGMKKKKKVLSPFSIVKSIIVI